MEVDLKTELLSKQECLVSFSVEAPQEFMRKDETEIIAKYVRLAKINGYRPGKAPQDVVLRAYRKDIREEVLQKKLQDIFHKACETLSIRPLSNLTVKELKYDLFSPLSLTADVEVPPEFSLNDYKNIPLHSHPTLVTDAEVMHHIEQGVEEKLPFQKVENRAVQKKDFVTVDFEAFDDANQSLKKKIEAFRMTDDFQIPEISSALLEMNLDEEKKLEVQFPENYADEVLAGKKLNIHLRVKEIHTKPIPEFTEDYVKELTHGAHGNLDAYKVEVRHFYENDKRKHEEQHLRNQIAQHLVASHSFNLPPALLKKEVEQAYKGSLNYFHSLKLSASWIKENQEKIFKNALERAIFSLKLEWILKKIMEVEKLELTEAELDQVLEKEAAERKMSIEDLRRFLLSEKRYVSFHYQTQIEKVNQFILNHAKIEEHPNALCNA
jgi:trigger factor